MSTSWPTAEITGTGQAAKQYGTTVPYTLNPSSFPPASNALYRNEGNGLFTAEGARWRREGSRHGC